MSRPAILACATFLLMPSMHAQTPPRPQISGIAFVRVKSSDFQKSSETYTKILGLRTGTNGCINVKNPCFVVNASQHIELTQAQLGDPGSWLDEVAFRTNSVREMHDYLLSQRVSVSEIKNTPHGIPFIESKDPEGNRIAFVQSFSEISVAR
ncbi:MAG: VOC family protein, partial [Candidatus Acidiferrum sp.]